MFRFDYQDRINEVTKFIFLEACKGPTVKGKDIISNTSFANEKTILSYKFQKFLKKVNKQLSNLLGLRILNIEEYKSQQSVLLIGTSSEHNRYFSEETATQSVALFVLESLLYLNGGEIEESYLQNCLNKISFEEKGTALKKEINLLVKRGLYKKEKKNIKNNEQKTFIVGTSSFSKYIVKPSDLKEMIKNFIEGKNSIEIDD